MPISGGMGKLIEVIVMYRLTLEILQGSVPDYHSKTSIVIKRVIVFLLVEVCAFNL